MITRHISQDGILLEQGNTVYYEDEAGHIVAQRFPNMPKRHWDSLYVSDRALVASIAKREHKPVEIEEAVRNRISRNQSEFIHSMSKLMYRIFANLSMGGKVSEIVNNEEVISLLGYIWEDLYGEEISESEINTILYRGYFSEIDED